MAFVYSSYEACKCHLPPLLMMKLDSFILLFLPLPIFNSFIEGILWKKWKLLSTISSSCFSSKQGKNYYNSKWPSSFCMPSSRVFSTCWMLVIYPFDAAGCPFSHFERFQRHLKLHDDCVCWMDICMACVCFLFALYPAVCFLPFVRLTTGRSFVHWVWVACPA